MFTAASKFKWHGFVVVTLIVFTVVLYYTGSAKMQGKVKRTISEMKYYPKTITPPITIHRLNIKGKSVEFSSMYEEGNRRLEKAVRPEAEFEEGDDFLDEMSFEITNQSDQKITFINFMIKLYTKEGIRKNSFDAAFPAAYGKVPGSGGLPGNWVLFPGQTTTILIRERIYPELRNKLNEIISDIVRVGINAQMVAFEDGSYWNFDGKTFPPPKTQKQTSLRVNGRQNLDAKSKEVAPFSLVVSSSSSASLKKILVGDLLEVTSYWLGQSHSALVAIWII